MRHISRLVLLCAGGSLLFFTGCGTGTGCHGSYHVTAYRPHDPSKVKVKLSTSTQNMLCDGRRRPADVMAVQANVGKATLKVKPQDLPRTGAQTFAIYSKQKERRLRLASRTEVIRWLTGANSRQPMDFTKGLSGLCRTPMVAFVSIAKRLLELFALTRIGHARGNRELASRKDKRYGKPGSTGYDQSRDPDPPRAQLMSPSWFTDPPGPLLVDQ